MNQRFTNGLSVTAIIISIITAFSQYSTANLANQLNKILVDNSKRQLEFELKKSQFDIINTLYKDFYQFDDHNSLVIRKLKGGDRVQDEYFLGLYLNGFEDLYEQCKTGLITKEQIRVNFQHLLNPICKNSQVDSFIQFRGNGLRILCAKFYPNASVGKKADLSQDACH